MSEVGGIDTHRSTLSEVENNVSAAPRGDQEDQDLVYLSSATLTRRQEYIDKEEEARRHSKRALYYRRNADYDTLISACSAKLNQNPKNLRALLIRASSYLKKKMFNEALTDYTEVLKLEADHVDALFQRGSILQDMSGAILKGTAPGQPPPAPNPDAPDGGRPGGAAGDAENALKMVEDAIGNLSRVLELEPNHVKAAYARATCYNLQGDYQRAIEDYNMALKKDQELSEKRKSFKSYRERNRQSRQEAQAKARATAAERGKRQEEEDLNAKLAGLKVGEGTEEAVTAVEHPGDPGARSRAASHGRLDLLPGAGEEGAPGEPEAAGRSPVAHSTAQDDIGLAAPSFRGSVEGVQDRAGPPALASMGGSAGLAPAVTASMIMRPGAAELRGAEEAQPAFMRSESTVSASGPGSSDTLRPALTPEQQELQRKADLHHARGYAYRKQNNFAAAIQEYSQAVDMCPTHFKALFNRAFSYDKIGDYEHAIADYTRALAVDPSNSYAYYNRGITWDRMGNFDKAIEDFGRAIDLDASNADFYHNRGFSLRKQGRFDGAVLDYTRAIELNPKHCRAFYNRAFSYDRLKRFEEAVEDYTRALEIEPGNATAYHNRGSLYERLGKPQEALSDFSKAIQLDASSALSFNARGLLLERLGKVDQALADFDKAVQLEPNNPVFLRNRGLCHRTRGAFRQAIADFNRVLDLAPKDVTALSNRGYAYRKLGDFDRACQDYTRALELSPGSVRLYNNRGYCLAKLGRYNEAICDYNAVIELDPSNTHAFHNRGISYDKLGMFEEAIKDFTKVLELDPTNVNAYFNRGSAYDSIGNYELAVADYARALDLDASQQSTPRGSTPSSRGTPRGATPVSMTPRGGGMATPRARSSSAGGDSAVSSRAGSFTLGHGATGQMPMHS